MARNCTGMWRMMATRKRVNDVYEGRGWVCDAVKLLRKNEKGIQWMVSFRSETCARRSWTTSRLPRTGRPVAGPGFLAPTSLSHRLVWLDPEALPQVDKLVARVMDQGDHSRNDVPHRSFLDLVIGRARRSGSEAFFIEDLFLERMCSPRDLRRCATLERSGACPCSSRSSPRAWLHSHPRHKSPKGPLHQEKGRRRNKFPVRPHARPTEIISHAPE